MSHTPYNKSIWTQARSYYLLVRSGECSAAQLSQIKLWLAEDKRHTECFREMELQHQQIRYSSMGESALLSQRNSKQNKRFRHSFKYWLSAACIAIVTGIFLLLHLPRPTVLEYKTAIGEVTEFSLPDGSEIILGAKSRVELVFTESERRVTQVEGDAVYRVSKDPERPFIVISNGTEIRVLGTVFEVARRHNALQVVVAEGHVSVSNTQFSEELVADQFLRVEENGSFLNIQTTDAKHFASWRQQRFIFQQTSVAEIVSVINRYRQHPIKFSHPKIGQQKVSASFRLEQLNQFLDALKVSHNLDWHIDSNGVIWLQI